MKKQEYYIPILFFISLFCCLGLIIFALVFPFKTEFAVEKTFDYRFLNGIFLCITYLPAIFCTGILFGFSFYFGKFNLKSKESFSPEIFECFKKLFAVSLVCVLILLVVTELCAPLIQKRQSEKIRIEEDYTQYCTLAEKLMEEKKWQDALHCAEYASFLRPEGEKAAHLLRSLEILSASHEEKSKEELSVLQEEISEPLEVYSLKSSIKACKENFEKKEWFAAHYYGAIALSLMDARDLNYSTINYMTQMAWNNLQETNNMTNSEESELYRAKRAAYEAFILENYVDAYYKFLVLCDKYPLDVDAKRFLTATKEKLKNHYFYRDETLELQPFETYRGVHFKYYFPQGGYNVVFIKGITFLQEGGKLVLYLRGLSVYTYSDDDILEKSFFVPYGKMSAIIYTHEKKTEKVPYLILQSMDRNLPDNFIRPEVTVYKNGIKTDVPSVMTLDLPYDDFLLLCDASLGAEKMPFFSLLHFIPLAEKYGYSSEVFMEFFALRCISPFILLILFMIVGIIAWNYRVRPSASFKLIWVFYVPIFICLSNYSMQIINYIVSLVIYFFIGLFGLSTLVVFLFCLLLVILFVSLVFLSRSGE